MSIQFADFLMTFQAKSIYHDKEPLIVKQKDWTDGSSKFSSTMSGHNLFDAMIFWLSEKQQKKFYKDLGRAELKMKVKNWVAKEASPKAILTNMMKASIKMGEVTDGMAKFAGDSKDKPKKRKWSGRKKRKG